MNIYYKIKKHNKIFFYFIIYDIFSDLAYFMIDSEVEERPWWFNIFMGTSLFSYLIKVHAFKYFCEYFSKKKSESNYLYYFSIFLALPHFIFYFYFSIKNNFIKSIISISSRYKIEFYITHFTTSIYPFIILFNPIKNLIEKLNKKEVPLFLENPIFIILYFGIIFRIFLDFLQTATLKNIQYFLFENEILFFSYSHSLTKITCILTTIFFFITYYFAKKLQTLSKLSFYKSELIESFDDLEKGDFIIDIKNIEESANKEFPIKNIIDQSVKKTIGSFLEISPEYIRIEYKEDFYENLSNNKSKFFSILNKNEKIKNYIIQNSLLLFDEIDSYLYINEEESDPEIFSLKEELLKNNINAIFSWGNNNSIDGIIVIEESKIIYSRKKYNETNIKKIIYITEQLKILQNNFNQRQNVDILNFKSKTLEDFANYITSIHENILKNLNNILYKINSHILTIQKKRKKWSDEKKPYYFKTIEDLIDENSLTEINFLKNEPLIYRDKINTFIISKIENKKDISFLILAFPFSFIDFNKHKFILIFTEIGKKISEILPGNENSFCEYKNKLINILNDSRPNIIILDNLKIKYLVNIYKNLEDINFKIYSSTDFKNENCIKNIFDKIFFENILNNKIILIVQNFYKLDSNLQKKMLEEYIKKENEAKILNIKLKLILTILEIQSLTYLNSNIINISMIYDLNMVDIKETLFNEKKNLIEKICKNIILINISDEQIEEVFKLINSKIDGNWTFYGLIDFIEEYFKENELEDNICIDSSIQKAIILGKYALKNDELMFSLAKIYKNNFSKIAKMLGIHKSSVSRFFKNYKETSKKL